MIPFQKIFTILIRTFSRPMLAYFKQKQKAQKNNWIGTIFVSLGRGTYTFQTWMSRSILKKPASHKSVEIKDEILLEKGVQTFYEMLFYLIVLGLPFWQLYKSSLASQKKQEALRKRIITLDKKLQQVNKQLKKTVQFLKKQNLQKTPKTTSKGTVKKENSAIVGEQTKIEANQQQQNSIQMQQLLQNALEVVADQFQDSLDEIQIQQQSEPTQQAGDQSGLDLQADVDETAGDESVSDSSPEIEVEVETEFISESAQTQ